MKSNRPPTRKQTNFVPPDWWDVGAAFPPGQTVCLPFEGLLGTIEFTERQLLESLAETIYRVQSDLFDLARNTKDYSLRTAIAQALVIAEFITAQTGFWPTGWDETPQSEKTLLLQLAESLQGAHDSDPMSPADRLRWAKRTSRRRPSNPPRLAL